MEENPYSTLAGAFAGPRTGPAFRLGEVKKLSPLTVNVAGAEISGGIYVNAALLSGSSRSWSLTGEELTISGGMTPASGPATGSGLQLTAEGPAIAPGDQVLLLTLDDQTFYLLCKVVRP